MRVCASRVRAYAHAGEGTRCRVVRLSGLARARCVRAVTTTTTTMGRRRAIVSRGRRTLGGAVCTRGRTRGRGIGGRWHARGVQRVRLLPLPCSLCFFVRVCDTNAFRAFDDRVDTGSRLAPPSPPRRPAPRLSSPRLRRTDRCGTRVRPRLRT